MITTTYGLRLEAIFKKILKHAGIRQGHLDFLAQALLLDAVRINPKRVETVRKHRYLHRATTEEILDWVFGIDHLIDVNGGADPVYAAIDLTADSSKISEKVTKALRLKPMWHELGAEQFFVIHLSGDPEDLTTEGVKALEEQLWASMEAAFNGPKGRIHVIRLTLS